MRFLLAFLLLAHGIAHLPGFLVGWQLASLPDLALSLLLCAAGWPEARLGLLANAVIALSLVAMRLGMMA